MPAVTLTTALDMLDQLMDYQGGAPPDARSARDGRRAILSGYREFVNAHKWSYYFKQGRIPVVAPQSSSTIAYDHEGGSHARMVTLASGTWPSWAAFGVLKVGNVLYEVAERKSDTVITLSITSNPGNDLAAGTSYTLFRDTYPLPTDFIASDDQMAETNWSGLTFVHPREWLSGHRVGGSSSGTPSVFSIMGDPNYYGAMAARFYPYPDQAQTIDFIYSRRARPISVFEYKTGSVTGSQGSTTITGTGTAWTPSMVGAVIRFSGDSTNVPTGLEGSSPFVQERVISTYTDGDTLDVNSALSAALVGYKYTISDPIDVEPGVMLSAFMRCCEKQMALFRRASTDEKRLAADAYELALRGAKIADNRYMARRSPAWEKASYRDIRDYPSGADVDNT